MSGLQKSLFLKSLPTWFAADKAPCPLCGGRAVAGAPGSHPPIPLVHPAPREALQSLCADCLGAIPWIAYPACRICGRAENCGDCARQPKRYFKRSRCGVRYDGRMRELLAMYKYRGSEKLEPILSAMLAFAYERLCEELRFASDRRPSHRGRHHHPVGRFASAGSHVPAIATSIPLSRERLQDRGFNQAERMARRVCFWYGLEYRPLLRRLRHTEKQSLKNRRNRVTDMKGNFALIPHSLRSYESAVPILLVDDVYTTGSTINECARTLAEGADPAAGPQIFGLLWSRS